MASRRDVAEDELLYMRRRLADVTGSDIDSVRAAYDRERRHSTGTSSLGSADSPTPTRVGREHPDPAAPLLPHLRNTGLLDEGAGERALQKLQQELVQRKSERTEAQRREEALIRSLESARPPTDDSTHTEEDSPEMPRPYKPARKSASKKAGGKSPSKTRVAASKP